MILDPPVTDALTLKCSTSLCQVLPQLGGSIGAWTLGAQPMLRTASVGGIAARDPYATAGFPLVPYSNRIAQGRFEWDGRHVNLERNFPPEPHAIHGVGFERPWQVLEQGEHSVLLSLMHRPDAAWPWSFEARQLLKLEEEALTLELSAQNLEQQAVPLAFGHHPYFPRAGAVLTFEARAVWLLGADGLPGRRAEPFGQFDFSGGRSVEQVQIDHCYTGWNGRARIAWPGKRRALEITASRGLSNAVIYIQPDLDAFCFEPVAHLNDALNRPGQESAMPVVAPGASFSASIRYGAI